jgi:hypothetical protein
MNKITKWFTISEWVDIETGELLHKEIIKDYYKIQTTKKIEINGNQGIIKYTNECRNIRQQKLEL